MATVNSLYVIIGLIVTILTLIGLAWKASKTLWSIAQSVKGTTDSLAKVEKDLLEIKITLDRADERIDAVSDTAKFNERDLRAAFVAIDKNTETLAAVIKRCQDLQDQKLKSVLG